MRARPRRSPGAARRAGDSPGFTMPEMALGLFLVFALVLGLLLVVTWEGGDIDRPGGVNPYRAHYAGYIHDRLLAWRGAIMNYRDMTGVLPGDGPGGTNATGGPIGNGNGRVERENGENQKFFSDLHGAGLASEPVVRVRSRIMDFYWADLTRNGTTAKPDHYMKLPNIHADEALAYDFKYDDKNRLSGDAVFFPNPDGTVDLFVRFNPY
ncbi:MAG: hypothetical protein AB1916_12025 [Thermodesulfobacteriota bacterium]